MIFTKGVDSFFILSLVVFFLFYLFFFVKVKSITKVLNRKISPFFSKFVLRTIYFVLLLFVLLGPSFGQQKGEIEASGKDIFLLVDLSASMDAIDVKPSRLERVKFELDKLVSAFYGNRIGLVIFTSSAFVQCPLTYDHEALMLFIKTLNTNLISSTGTDFYNALELVMNKFEKDELAKPEKQSKIVILISDGEAHGTKDDDIALEFVEKGIHLFLLGVGTKNGSKIPNQNGRFKTDKNGKQVISRLDEQSMKELANNTNGGYFTLSNNNNDVNRLINSVEKIENTVFEKLEANVSADKYYYFLMFALLLMAVDILFTQRIIKISS